ncbi:hypothetical protein GCM10009557_21450 [Virgisporangium ochraceum]|uniref:Uncharacterized protein n=1 Tax=Virgisporangium ochraceum TaxID=65505 RepID=A0A8J3ZRW0_9ACTN|nr:hypothetical protein [Virgisporangium ochraceum]GIJ67897.1 hypothetical protein Voc01_028140 [Virgisporangium ochraceum]
MTIPAARSHNEAMMFVLLRECRGCGRTNRDLTDELHVSETGAESHAEYTAFCRDCGNIDVYRLRLPAADPQAGERGVVFGGPEPSRILDAGEWVSVALRTSANTPEDPAGMTDQERSDAALAMHTAAAAVREAAKFIEPGRERLPRSAMWTDVGREEFDRDPWRFSRPRLAVLERAYLEAAERLADGRPIWN